MANLQTFGEAFWDEQYRGSHHVWSGRPNRHLVAEIAGLAPGSALDAGCGEGADALWLAGRGWTVSAVDISSVALERAAARGSEAGLADRIEWVHHDLAGWDPGPSRFDLVSVQYLQLPKQPRDVTFRRLFEVVARGGTLLVVGHHPSDLSTTVPRPPLPELFFTGDEVLALLDGDGWTIVTNATPERRVTDPHGSQALIHDVVVRAQRC